MLLAVVLITFSDSFPLVRTLVWLTKHGVGSTRERVIFTLCMGCEQNDKKEEQLAYIIVSVGRRSDAIIRTRSGGMRLAIR